jgi:protein ATS1
MTLLALGSNGHGQLSLGHTQDTAEPQACRLPNSLDADSLLDAQLICGGNHTLLLTAEGHLYGCGSNEHNQLVTPNTADILQLTRLHEGRHWTHAACGFAHSLLVEDATRIYAMGLNDKGSLGLGEVYHTSILKQLAFAGSSKIHKIKASVTHVVVQTTTGQFYGFGSGRRGALGSTLLRQVTEPTQMALQGFVPDEVLDFCLGQHWTAIQTRSSVILFTTGGKRLQAGTFEACHSIAASWSTLHFVSMNGHVTAYGRSDRGQHAQVKDIVDLAAGSEHCLATTRSGTAVAWGWNEHGNCGNRDLQDVRSPVILSQYAAWIAAGYATSFIYTRDPLR